MKVLPLPFKNPNQTQNASRKLEAIFRYLKGKKMLRETVQLAKQPISKLILVIILLALITAIELIKQIGSKLNIFW